MVWAASHTYDLLGTRFRIQSEDAALIDGMDRLLEPFRIDGDPPARAKNTYALVDGRRMEGRGEGLLAYRDCKLIGAGADPSPSVAALLTSLNRAAVGDCELFAAHAGVVAIDGSAIALPAESGHGKSTLTAACLKMGFEYGSDEAICTDVSNGDIVPYPKPLGLSEWSRHALGVDDSMSAFPGTKHEGFLTAADLGADTASGRLRLGHVVITEYGHEQTELTEVAGSEGMRILLEMSFNHYKFGVDAFHLAARLTNEARTWRLTYDDPLEAARLLMDRFGR